MKPLVVIPNYMSHEADMEILGECIQSIRRTVSDTVDVLIIDDRSPQAWLVDVFEERYARYGFELIRKDSNEGFSRTVNVGLERAHAEGRDAILMNADIVMLTPGWLGRCKRAVTSPAVIGAKLVYPNGLIQHAGLYFSPIANVFEHRYRYAPGNLPEANQPSVCPVTGAFQYIPHAVLERVGVYDREFRMGYEDVDYCLRVFEAGFACVYDPAISAIHHESLFRSRPNETQQRWHDESIIRLREKWAHLPVAELVGGGL
jgi:O-antigen biosynthesis protein